MPHGKKTYSKTGIKLKDYDFGDHEPRVPSVRTNADRSDEYRRSMPLRIDRALRNFIMGEGGPPDPPAVTPPPKGRFELQGAATDRARLEDTFPVGRSLDGSHVADRFRLQRQGTLPPTVAPPPAPPLRSPLTSPPPSPADQPPLTAPETAGVRAVPQSQSALGLSPQFPATIQPSPYQPAPSASPTAQNATQPTESRFMSKAVANALARAGLSLLSTPTTSVPESGFAPYGRAGNVFMDSLEKDQAVTREEDRLKQELGFRQSALGLQERGVRVQEAQEARHSSEAVLKLNAKIAELEFAAMQNKLSAGTEKALGNIRLLREQMNTAIARGDRGHAEKLASVFNNALQEAKKKDSDGNVPSDEDALDKALAAMSKYSEGLAAIREGGSYVPGTPSIPSKTPIRDFFFGGGDTPATPGRFVKPPSGAPEGTRFSRVGPDGRDIFVFPDGREMRRKQKQTSNK